MKFNAALTVISLSCLSWQGKTEQADGVVLSPPAAEESLSHLLGELMANHNHIHDVTAAAVASGHKNATIQKKQQLVLQPERKDAKRVEDFDRFNRDEQERNCILLGAVGDRIPNSDEICTCSDTTGLDLTCSSMMGMCSGGTNNVCADSTEVYIDLNSGLMIEYRSEFPADYMDTTITLNLNNEGNRIEDCSATYNGDNCNCYACGDAESITVDCSAFNCRATTNGCQAVDLTARQLVTVVPDFQPSDWVCPTPAPVAAPTRAPVAPPAPTRAPVAPTPVAPQTPATPATPSRPIPTLPPDADRSCSIFAILGQQLPGADEMCYCSSEMEISCIFGATCGDNGLCADFVEIGVDMSAGLPAVNYCIDFVDDSGYLPTCIDMGINFDQTISGCSGATYGDNQCTCTVCEDNVSLDIDCSMHDPGATTNGCQGMPENLGPLIPNFEMRTGMAGTGGGDMSTGGGEPVDCTFYPRGDPRPPPDGPKDCFLYTMLQTELPDYAENCECDGQVALNCYMDHVCTDGICVDQMNAVASLENGNNAETCAIFSDPRVDELCVSIAVNLDQTILGCNYATYGGQECRCEVCEDQVSLTVDCSEYNEYAIAECQGMDGLEPAVIGFRMPPPDDCAAEGGSTGGGETETGVPDDDFVAEPWPPEGANQVCQIMSLGTAQLPPGAPPLEDFCICESETELACRFYDACQNGLCANQVDTGLDIGTGTPQASYCTDFRGGIFEDTCVTLEVDFAMTIQQCVEATYGGLPCECTVCDDRQSMIIDCSMHNPDATTVTCQTPPTEIGPIIPQFQHDGATSDGGSSSALSDCPLINLLDGRIPDTNPETSCECVGEERVDCVQEDYCYNSRLTQSATCAESVDFSIDVTQGVHVINCATFDDELNGYEFETTCVEVAVGIELQLEECVGVTYGGRACTCEVCPGNNAIELDCTEYDENAWIPCQPLNIEERITPFVPHFMGSVDGSNENLQRAGCSGAPTTNGAAVSFFAKVAASVLVVCVSVFMI